MKVAFKTKLNAYDPYTFEWMVTLNFVDGQSSKF
jgi:hypothetical protein